MSWIRNLVSGLFNKETLLIRTIRGVLLAAAFYATGDPSTALDQLVMIFGGGAAGFLGAGEFNK